MEKKVKHYARLDEICKLIIILEKHINLQIILKKLILKDSS